MSTTSYNTFTSQTSLRNFGVKVCRVFIKRHVFSNNSSYLVTYLSLSPSVLNEYDNSKKCRESKKTSKKASLRHRFRICSTVASPASYASPLIGTWNARITNLRLSPNGVSSTNSAEHGWQL